MKDDDGNHVVQPGAGKLSTAGFLPRLLSALNRSGDSEFSEVKRIVREAVGTKDVGLLTLLASDGVDPGRHGIVRSDAVRSLPEDEFRRFVRAAAAELLSNALRLEDSNYAWARGLIIGVFLVLLGFLLGRLEQWLPRRRHLSSPHSRIRSGIEYKYPGG